MELEGIVTGVVTHADNVVSFKLVPDPEREILKGIVFFIEGTAPPLNRGHFVSGRSEGCRIDIAKDSHDAYLRVLAFDAYDKKGGELLYSYSSQCLPLDSEPSER